MRNLALCALPGTKPLDGGLFPLAPSCSVTIYIYGGSNVVPTRLLIINFDFLIISRAIFTARYCLRLYLFYYTSITYVKTLFTKSLVTVAHQKCGLERGVDNKWPLLRRFTLTVSCNYANVHADVQDF